MSTEYIPRDPRELALLLAIARLSAKIDRDLDDLDAAVAASLAFAKKLLTSLSLVVSRGEEPRDVECRIIVDREKSDTVMIIRMDTGEVVGRRQMTTEEKQMEMPLKPAA